MPCVPLLECKLQAAVTTNKHVARKSFKSLSALFLVSIHPYTLSSCTFYHYNTFLINLIKIAKTLPTRPLTIISQWEITLCHLMKQKSIVLFDHLEKKQNYLLLTGFYSQYASSLIKHLRDCSMSEVWYLRHLELYIFTWSCQLYSIFTSSKLLYQRFIDNRWLLVFFIPLIIEIYNKL